MEPFQLILLTLVLGLVIVVSHLGLFYFFARQIRQSGSSENSAPEKQNSS